MLKVNVTVNSLDKGSYLKFIESLKILIRDNSWKYVGPICFPNKRLKVITRRSPGGEGREFWDHWRMVKRKFHMTISMKSAGLGTFLEFVKKSKENSKRLMIKIKVQ